jgi:autotransporter-associated beta strand protein
LFACLSALLASALLPSAATAFDPTNLTGCVMWLQAASANVQTNPANGRVSQWNDLSGSGNHATQSDTNRQPLYVESGPNSLPTVYFDMRNYNNAYNARLLTGTPLTNACTTYLVARVLDGNELGISWRRLLGSRDKNWLLGTYTPGTFYAHGHNGELSGLITRLKSAYRFNRTYTLSSMNNTTSQYFYVNGHDLTGDPTKSTPPGRLSIGSVDGYNDEGEVQISEVLAYDRELSAAERQQVQDYLTARYGITDEGFSGPVWSGGSSSSSLWSDSANWQQPMPAAPMLAFYGNSRRTSTNDLTGLTLDSVLAWDGSWQLSGNPVTLNNGFLCNPATEVTWGLDTALPSGPHTFSVLTARRLTLSGVLSGDGGVTLGLGPDYAGTLALACPSNTFTGPVLLKGGIAEVTRLANAGQPSSLGAASGANAAVLLGNLRMGHSGGLRYVGSASASTDRPFSFIRLASIENNSPTGAGLTFNGAWAAADKALAGFAYLSLGGTSTGINTVNTPLANAPGGANALFVNVKGGVWAFTQPSTFTGTFSVDGGTVLVNGTSAGCLGASNVKVMPGATLGGTGLATSTGTLLQYPGAIISPGDPTVNGGIGCLTYGSTPGLSGVRLRCQVNAVTNDSIKINASVVVPGFMTVELVAASAAACPNRIRIIEATSMTGAIDLSGWEIEAPAPCVYRAVREGNAIVLVKDAPLALSTAWQRSMPIRFGGYTGSTALTNFPALVKLWDGCGNNRFRYRDCVANGADLLFTDDAGVTLQHEIEIWNTNGESHVWVQVPVLVKNTQITAYWKNPSMAADANLFLPTNLPNCGLWLHAGAGLTTNATGNVSVWADQSGNGRNATQGTAGAQPVWVASAANGLPALRFEAIGTKDGMATGWNATNKPYSYFVVGAFLTNSGGYNWRRIVQGSSGYNCGFATEGAGKFFLFTANPGGGYTLITNPDIRPNPGTPFVAGMIGDGTNTSASLNGFVFNTVAVHCGPNFLSLGASGNSGDGWAGDVQEVIAYDRALSYDERRQVERYLALKYDSLSAHRVPWTGLRQWIRGDTVNADVLDGSTPRVSKCENQTDTAATMHATQSTTNRMPEKVSASFNGKPALRFDAVAGQYDGLKAFATPIGKAYSVVAVYSTRATDAVERVVMQGANSASRLSVTNGVVTRRASGVVSQLLPCQTNTPVIATLLCDEITSRFYVNGVNLTQSTTPVGPWGATGVNDGVIFFGAGTTDSALDLPLDGDLAEVLVYDRIISDTERRRIEAYLGARYAIPVDTSNPRAWSSEFSGVWHFTGADRLLLADASSAQNGAALLGQAAPAATNAFAGQGLTWGSAAQLGRTRTAPAATPQTYSFWAKQAASPAAQALILAGTNGQPYAALNNTGNQLQVAGTDAAALVAPTTGAWTHYAVAVNPNGSVQAYGNGLPLSTVPTALAASLPTNQVLTVGHAVSASDATKTFAGTLDELRTETVSRGADWIRAAYMTQAQNDLFTSYNRWGTLILLR